MSRVSAAYRKLVLRGLVWDAETGGITLGEALKIAARARLSETSSGKVLTGTSRSGHAVSFTLPGNGAGLTPQDAAELTAELLDCYDRAVAALTAADENFNADDPQTRGTIQAWMLAHCAGFTAVRSTLTDFSGIRQEAAFAA